MENLILNFIDNIGIFILKKLDSFGDFFLFGISFFSNIFKKKINKKELILQGSFGTEIFNY